MHEMSIIQSLFEIVEEERVKNGLARITVVRLRVGAMAAVVPDSLEFCFEVITRGTAAEGARLEVEVVAVSGRCGACGGEFPVPELRFFCPVCASTEVEITAGDEIRLNQLEGE